MWGARRRLLIVLVLAAVCIGGIFVFFLLKKASEQPLCTDGKQNGSETGVDCGGSCSRVCALDTYPLRVNWARVVPVTDTVYSVALSIINKNYDSVAFNAQYVCDLYSKDYIKTDTIKANVSVPPAGEFVYAHTGMKYTSSDMVPQSIRCQVLSVQDWLRLPQGTTPIPFTVETTSFTYSDIPTVKALLTNVDSKRTFQDVTVVGRVYDSTSTLVGVSTYFLDRIKPTEIMNISFTWPHIFAGVSPFRIEYTPVFNFPDFKSFSVK